MNKIKLLSLFSGIGAFEKALKNLDIDYDLVNFCEIDQFAIKSYCMIHDESPDKNLGDITKVDIEKIPEFDLMTYGFPCVDISVAGRKQGFEKDSNTRSSLLWTAMEIARTHKPKYMIAENVRNILSDKFKYDFLEWQKYLAEIGYKSYYSILNAKDYGIPQNRERVFVVSIRDDIEEYYQFPETVPLKIRLKDLLDQEVDEKYYLSNVMIKGFENHKMKNKEKGNGFGWKPTTGDGLATTIDTYANDRPANNYIITDAIPLTETRSDNAKAERRKNRSEGKDYCGRRDKDIVTKDDGIIGAICTSPSIEQSFIELKQVGVIGKDSEASRVYDTDGTSRCIKNGGGMGAKTGLYIDKNYENLRIRKLTPNESWRLMGFTDLDFKKCKDGGISDAQLYKQAGNSIVVNVLEAILDKLLKNKAETLMDWLN